MYPKIKPVQVKGIHSGFCHSIYLVISAFGVFLLAFYVSITYAGEVTLEWDRNLEADIKGYKIYYGAANGVYTTFVDVGDYTSCIISGLDEDTTYCFAATAYNSVDVESDFSNEVTAHIPKTDSDGDGIPDEDEINVYNTDPNIADTDGDGYSDGEEINSGYDPLDPQSSPSVENTPPVSQLQSVITEENIAVDITLIAHDDDNDPLTYIILSNPGKGLLSGTAPNLTYTPDTSYSGPDSFTFKANDGSVDSNVSTVSITINATTIQAEEPSEPSKPSKEKKSPSKARKWWRR